MKLEAKQRLLSFTPNAWLKTTGKTLKGETLPATAKLVTQEGNLCAYWTPSVGPMLVTFENDNRLLARMVLDDYKVVVAVVHPEMVGKGVGRFLYEAALKKFGKLESSDYLSKGSSSSWAALCKAHKGVLVVGKREVAIAGFYKDTKGYTFPILRRANGRKVKLGDLLSSAKGAELEAAENAFYRIRK